MGTSASKPTAGGYKPKIVNKAVISLAAGDQELNKDGSKMFLISTQETDLHFNSEKSFALCAGVGRQIKMKKFTHDIGIAADNDSKVLSHLLKETFKFPKQNCTTLCDGDDEKLQATAANIKRHLKICAGKVERDGLLVLHFSGHCMKDRDNQAVLIAADFDRNMPKRKCVISMKDIQGCVKGSKVKNMLLLLDCCYAGRAARALVVDWNLSNSIYVLAACKAEESAMSYSQLGNGVFTYSMTTFWENASDKSEFASPTEGIISLSRCLQHCQEICQAFITLTQPTMQGANMQPQLLMSKHLDDVDSSDANMDENKIHPYDYLYPYLFLMRNADRKEMPRIPPLLQRWFDDSLLPSLRTLVQSAAGNMLVKRPAFSTAMILATQSAAVFLSNYLHLAECPDCIFHTEWFLVVFMHISEAIATVDAKLKPKLQHVPQSLVFFIQKVREITQLEVDDEKLEELFLLYDWISRDVKNQRSKDVSDGPAPAAVSDGFLAQGTDDKEVPTLSAEDKLEIMDMFREFDAWNEALPTTDIPLID